MTPTTIGPYRVLEKLGEGGMGQVYRARDTRLDRDVALKVLPDGFVADADRLARFAQEARAAAALNHPNILAVYDVGTHEGQPFLVSELLEGHSLRDLLRAGALPLRKALDYAIQIATGLAAAHDRGIVHRDLKPDNIFITSDGRAKVLDFGIAKLLAPTAPTPTVVTELPPQTDAGVVLGTAGYMAPEQIRGGAVDHRTDVFALGVTLFEMLSGTRPFAAATPADAMSAVLSRDPAELTTPDGTAPPAVDRIVRRCLEKQPEHRFQSARDVAFALEALTLGTSHTSSGSVAAIAGTTRRIRPRELAAWTLLTLVSAVAIGWALRPPRDVTRELPTRFTIEIPLPILSLGMGTAVSPDGRWFALGGMVAGRGIYVRPRDGDSFTQVAGSEGSRLLGWTPDSQSLVLAQRGELRLASISGAGSRSLARLPGDSPEHSAVWSADGNVIVWLARQPLHILRAGASTLEPIAPLDAGVNEIEQSLPVFLPDGRRFFYVSRRGDRFALRLRSLDSGEVQDVPGLAELVIWAGERHVLFRRGAALFAQEISYAPLELRRAPIPVASDVFIPNADAAYASASVTAGALMYRRDEQPSLQFTWFARDGRQLNAVGPPGHYLTFSLADDGSRVIASRRDAGVHNLWSIDIGRGTINRVTAGDASDVDPRVSPDGRVVVFASTRDSRRSPYRTTIAGDEPARMFEFSGNLFALDDWSRDGRWLLFRNAGAPVLQALPLDRLNGEPIVVTRALAGVTDQATMSPDGRWVAYNSSESGRTEIYVVPFPPTGDKWQVSTDGGAQPQWRADGRELYFLTLDGMLSAVSITTTPAFRAGEPVALFRAPLQAVNTEMEQYAAAADGTRFLFLPHTQASSPSAVTVLTNWMSLLP